MPKYIPINELVQSALVTDEMLVPVADGDSVFAVKAKDFKFYAETDGLDAVVAEIEALKAAVGSPLTASTAADMEDEDKVYVYVGETTAALTNGHWYYYNNGWQDGGVYNAVTVNTDDTLSVEDMAADSKAVGDRLAVVENEFYTDGANELLAKGLCDLAGHYEASRLNNGITIDSGGYYVSNQPGNAVTNVINGSTFPADAIEIPSTAYRFKLVGFSGLPMGHSTYISQTPYITGGAGRYLFRKKDWNIFAICVTRNPADTTAFTSAELTTIAGLINRYVYNDAAERLEAAEETIVDRTTIGLDTSELSAGYGGLLNTGKAYPYTTRIRIRPATGLAAFRVLAGSTITPNAGYKFNVAMYSEYVSNSNFTLLGYETLRTTAYTVPYDCYIRIGVGTTNDDELWTLTDNVYALTQAGQTALENALTLNLVGGTLKSEVENIKAVIEQEYSSIHTIDSIPLNATEYHALWSALMTEQPSIVRTKITDITAGSDTYPIYMYTIRPDMDYLASNYSRVTWNGSNELYDRPKIFISSGIHGAERGTPMALFEFVRSLFNDINYLPMRNAFDWYILPLANPWGFSHTAYNGGSPTGGGYDPATDTVVENTSAVHEGIRQNADGKDCNRHFYTHTSPSDPMPAETQAVMDALAAATADGRDFVFAMDMHQAWTGSANNAIGAFLSMSYGATDDAKDLIYGKWMQAGAVTEKDFAEWTDRENVQSVFPWDGTTNYTLRNYLANFADYATCFEGGIRCQYYGGTSELSNPIARAFASTQMHNFMQKLTEIWMAAADEEGGGGTQSDWSQTDTTAADYIKNKPTIPSTAAEVGAVPTTRTVNGKALSADITLDASDVGAGTYSKPSGGIPASDLASAVQTSLGKADTALQAAPVTSVNGQTGAVTVTVPTKTSDLTNDSGFLTAHQDISGKVNVAQGVGNAGKFLVVGSDGNVAPVTMTAWSGGNY